LRIKAAYASMRGRCPECGNRIEALRPAAPTVRVSHAREPAGLVPIEDEWPEPADVQGAESPGQNYQIATDPVTWPVPAPAPAPAGEPYGLASNDGRPAAPVRFDPPAEPYAVVRAAETGPKPGRDMPTAAEVARFMPEPPPPPPRFVLWSGLYLFPLRAGNLFVWAVTGFNLTILALIAAGVVYLLGTGGNEMIGIPILLAGGGIVFAWAGIYAANCFLAVVEETAAGNDAVVWPPGGNLIDGLGRFFYVLWLVGCAVMPAAALWAVRGDRVSGEEFGWLIPLLVFLVTFAVLFLSALAADAWWMLLDPKIVGGLLLRPTALFLVTVPALLLLAACVGLTDAMADGPKVLLAPAVGYGWATFLLIYGRLVGRAGWIVTETKAKKKRRTPRRRAAPRKAAGAGELAERDL
jgi:hypothetical protein